MGAPATVIDIKSNLISRSSCLGNTGIGLKEVCSQLIDDEIKRGRNVQYIADKTFLSPATVDRMWKLKEAESGLPYRPTADTCERIFKAFGAEVYFNQVKIKRANANKPKVDV